MKFDTKSVHSGRKPDPDTGAIITPIYQTSTFLFEDFDKPRECDYSRTNNPNRIALGKAIADLDGGHHGFIFSSGMAAVTTVIHLLKAGDHVISCDDLYGGTQAVCRYNK